MMQVREMYAPFECGMKSGTARVYDHEIPGGQYSNLMVQCQSMGIWDKWEQVRRPYHPAASRARPSLPYLASLMSSAHRLLTLVWFRVIIQVLDMYRDVNQLVGDVVKVHMTVQRLDGSQDL